jgi:hypothetical protein
MQFPPDHYLVIHVVPPLSGQNCSGDYGQRVSVTSG